MVRMQLKRIYDAPSPDDGFRVLVDRVWPRGMTKEKAAIDLWAKDIAPSTDLRKWFDHDPEKWGAFQEKYREELRNIRSALEDLVAKAEDRPLTFLYGAKDEKHNQAIVLLDFMKSL